MESQLRCGGGPYAVGVLKLVPLQIMGLGVI